ncbi:MAG: Gfo/Idh/MocA family oxidoreductase [Pirellulales bacterium]|nr:Gfo/Idh/MocA family oxidoreductase [Pirellulales bacterium]
MSQNDPSQASSQSSRRQFLKASTAVAAGALAGGLAIGRSAHAAGDDTLKVGLVGCGGRGTGAAVNALSADKNCKLTAMADAFEDRLQGSLNSLRNSAVGAQVAVADEQCFVGFDAYQKLIDSGVDVVLLCTTPHFRPRQLKACIDAGKHVFCEKPVAVDAPGIRSILASSEAAKQKNLCIVSGLCWRYHYGVRETMQRVLDGAIGDILAMQETYLTGALWTRPRRPEQTEMEYQMRNWYNYTWLSGDHNVEQHVHSLDKASWAMGDQPPVRAWGLGGRQARDRDPQYGTIFDHHAVVYEYANGVKFSAFCRQQRECYNDTSDQFVGTKGRADILKHRIDGENEWRFRGNGGNMYDIEHHELFAAIRSGKPINNGRYMAVSTMLAILGRMVTYTGQTITWDAAINSKEDLSPSSYAWDADPPTLPDEQGHYEVAVPGVTTFV